jgi:heptosyltransferase-2
VNSLFSKKKIMADNIRKILIRGVNWIGDAFLTTPAIHEIRKAFPDAYISLLVKPLAAEIFRGNPDINDIILYEKRFEGFMGRLRLARMLRSRGFHTAILLQNAFDAALITWLAGIPERIGYKRDSRGPLLTTPVPVHKELSGQYQAYYYTGLLKESLNIMPGDIRPHIYLSDDETSEARTLLNTSLSLTPETPLIGINPGATYGSAKRWLPERFAEVITRAINELNGRAVLFGSRSETDIAKEIVSHSRFPDSAFLNLAGKTGLRQLAAIMSECDVFITNDSGPMHMASALRVPTVAIFGSTDSKATGPFGEGHKVVSTNIECAPCLKRECPEKHLRCMTEISADDVFNALKEILPTQTAVFLDRDGTLNEDTGYLSSFSELRIFDDALDNLQRLKSSGFRLIGITNQSGIARGLVSEEFVNACNAYLQKTLGIDDFYYCPHHPDEVCQCRKPRTMMIRDARLKHHINLKTSYVIGDKTLDILLAKAVGAKGILVLTGHDRESGDADFIAKNLTEAVDWILKQK